MSEETKVDVSATLREYSQFYGKNKHIPEEFSSNEKERELIYKLLRIKEKRDLLPKPYQEEIDMIFNRPPSSDVERYISFVKENLRVPDEDSSDPEELKLITFRETQRRKMMYLRGRLSVEEVDRLQLILMDRMLLRMILESKKIFV